MNVTFSCPRCEQTARVDLEPASAVLVCSHCKSSIAIPPGGAGPGNLVRCLVCTSRDLYLRKDFPQRLGVLIVAVGFVASSVTWAYSRPIWTFAILFATALVDVVLYLVMPSALSCYHCGSAYRDLPTIDGYASFDLETHERYRQQAIRVAEHERIGRAASAVSAAKAGLQTATTGQNSAADRVQ
jgi:hypothetical protein